MGKRAGRLRGYHDEHRTLPPHAVFDKAGRPLLSWRELILPYLEQEDLYQQFKLDEPSCRRLLAERYGVWLNRVAGCVVWPWEVTRRGCRSRQPCPYNRKLARRCPAPDRLSRSSRRTAGHAVRPWAGAAPFSVIASPRSHDTPASSFGFRPGNRAFQVPLWEPGV
jgi:hypothetical protein